MLGYLLARAGVPVTVIEKHRDFFRDFRGDTVHPSTLEVFHELGLLEEFLKLPHQEVHSVNGVLGDFPFQAADFRYVPARSKFVALMPQWDFLDFLSAKAKEFPHFDLRMEWEATGVVCDAERITGVEARTPEGTAIIRTDLTIGCDGRHSIVRQSAHMELLEFGVPIDVLWFRISREKDDPEQLLGTLNYGRALVLINRDTYFQAALIIEKGSFPGWKSGGIEAFRQTIRKMAPYLGERVNEVQNWEQVKLLTVQLNRLRKWHQPGLLCIGDAAHAMSPAGGVGINLAIQDAVAAANLLARPLREGNVTDGLLAAVQRRREFPTRITQFLQVNAHRGLAKLFQNPGPVRAPWQFKLVVGIPGLQHAVARVVGMGARPEHVAGAKQRECRGLARALVGACAVVAGIGVGVWMRRRGAALPRAIELRREGEAAL
jgi:2-polyprenyl-6-methoxyphenol hydroxylase-like FAD-dependent oxidoreductase